MANYRFKPALTEVKMIRKERLSEREFYHRIMEAISKLGYMDMLTEEQAVEFQNALREQGCTSYADYQRKEEEKGKARPPERASYQDLQRGEIYTAAMIIGQLLASTRNCQYFILNINDGSEDAPTCQWLQASRRRINVNDYYRRKIEDLDAYQRKPSDDDGEHDL